MEKILWIMLAWIIISIPTALITGLVIGEKDRRKDEGNF